MIGAMYGHRGAAVSERAQTSWHPSPEGLLSLDRPAEQDCAFLRALPGPVLHALSGRALESCPVDACSPRLTVTQETGGNAY